MFDFEDKKPAKSTFMSTKCIQNATLDELNSSEYLDSVYWKVVENFDKLDEID